MAMWERRKGGFAGRTQTTGGIQMGTTVGTEAAGWYETHRWCCALSAGTTVLEDEGKLLHHQRVGIDDPDPMLTFADCLVSLPHFRFLLDTDSTGEVFFPARMGIPSNHIQSTRMLENIYKRSSKQHETTYFQHHLRQGRWKPSRDGRDLSRNHATTLRAGAGRELGFVTRRAGPSFDELSWIIMNYCGLLWFRMF